VVRSTYGADHARSGLCGYLVCCDGHYSPLVYVQHIQGADSDTTAVERTLFRVDDDRASRAASLLAQELHNEYQRIRVAL